MSISEAKYREWCDRMAARAAFEQACMPTAMGHEYIDAVQTHNISDAESFHSTKSRPRRNVDQPQMPSRRHTLGDSNAEHIPPQTRTGTWPRSARSSLSHQKPTIPRRSSHASTPTRKRSELLSFHRESCELFSSMDAAAKPTDSGYSSVYRQGSSRLASTASFQHVPETSPRCSASITRPQVMLWKSEETRRMEYEKIDGAHSGLRGFCKKVLPKCCQSRRSWRKFFEGKCDGDSVRRMRMPFSDDDDEKADK